MFDSHTMRRAASETLSLSHVLGSLSSSETSVLTYSHFLVLLFVTELDGETPSTGDRRLGCCTAMQARTLLIGRCLRTIVVRIVPLVSVDLYLSRVPSRLGLVQQPLVGIPPSSSRRRCFMVLSLSFILRIWDSTFVS